MKAKTVKPSRFQTKLVEVRFFLKNPPILRPELSSRNRIWYVFCDFSISTRPAAPSLGGGMGWVDTFRVLEADVAKMIWNRQHSFHYNRAPDLGNGQLCQVYQGERPVNGVSSLGVTPISSRPGLEMEKRGHIVKSDCDANWLPNFGRNEKQKLPNVEIHNEMPVRTQPCISKQMRRDAFE
ncbi:TITAN protein [Salix suchowensis]|nr:TITAN protein [Salix suchowensis]